MNFMKTMAEDWNSLLAVIRQDCNDKEFKDNFRAACTDKQKVEIVFKNAAVRNKIRRWISGFDVGKYAKSSTTCEKLRKEGNAHFQRKQFEVALKYYTKVILSAPFELSIDAENHLAIGYANRSAALFHLEQFKECLSDIERSLETNYPLHLRHKLYLRKAYCLHKLNCHSECVTAAEMALTSLQADQNISFNRKDQLHNEILNVIRKSKSLKTHGLFSTTNDKVLPFITNGEHCTVKSMSSALEVRHTAQKGRHIVAKQNVKEGEAIFVEKPFASVLLPRFYNSHCHHCHGRMITPLPCQSCSFVGYCSVECQEVSWNVYHRLECGLLQLLHLTGIAHLVLRIILVAGVRYLFNIRERLNQLEENRSQTIGISKNIPYEGYFAVHSLVSNSEYTKLEDSLAYSLTTLMLLELLQPELECHGATEEDAVFIGSLMLRHLQQLICNAHAITELCYSKIDRSSSVEDVAQERVATAIYPSASLLNHSCEPTVINSFCRNILIVRSVREVSAGDELFNCYGPHFKHMPQSERKSVLSSQYFFDCRCKHCVVEECCAMQSSVDVSRFEALGDANKMSEEDLIKIEANYQSTELFVGAVQFLSEGRYRDALRLAEECLKLQIHCLQKYDRRLGETFDMIARIHAEQGNYMESIDYLRNSVDITKANFGPKSIEVANEIQKYADVALKAVVENQIGTNEKAKRFVESTLAILNQGIQIFQVQYGDSHVETRELVKKCLTLKTITCLLFV